MLTAHPMDAVVFIPNCDKVVPGMLMAACPDEPALHLCQRRPDDAGRNGDKRMGLNEMFEAVGSHATGAISDKELRHLEEVACPGCGLLLRLVYQPIP